jgi:hypothetical protein
MSSDQSKEGTSTEKPPAGVAKTCPSFLTAEQWKEMKSFLIKEPPTDLDTVTGRDAVQHRSLKRKGGGSARLVRGVG